MTMFENALRFNSIISPRRRNISNHAYHTPCMHVFHSYLFRLTFTSQFLFSIPACFSHSNVCIEVTTDVKFKAHSAHCVSSFFLFLFPRSSPSLCVRFFCVLIRLDRYRKSLPILIEHRRIQLPPCASYLAPSFQRFYHLFRYM